MSSDMQRGSESCAANLQRSSPPSPAPVQTALIDGMPGGGGRPPET